jgi:hypothetical protein
MICYGCQRPINGEPTRIHSEPYCRDCTSK